MSFHKLGIFNNNISLRNVLVKPHLDYPCYDIKFTDWAYMSRSGEKVNRLKQMNPLTDTEAIYFPGKGPWKSVCSLDLASLSVIIFLLSEFELSRDLLRRSKYENYVSYL